MVTVAIVSPGHMGAGLGGALRGGGARVVATTAGRSERTRRLAAGLEVLPNLDEVIMVADVVLSVTPPAQALPVAHSIAAAAGRTGATPVVADLNAVAPQTMARIAEACAGLPVVDGSISGPPPSARPGARIYLSGPQAPVVAGLPWNGQVAPVVLAGGLGSASALKMCTAGVYKGMTALITQAMRTAGRHGVLEQVLADLARNGLDDTAGVVSAATKAHRFVDEMREIAVTQQEAGLTPALFEALAVVYADIAGTELAAGAPETADRQLAADEIVHRLSRRGE
jgi:3-hydroxyisobutyrate dehydrogenase-like beta-hydroxyacid dehydrogenase